MTTTDTFRTAATLKANGATFVAIGKELGVSDKTAKNYVVKGQAILEEEAQTTTDRKPRPRKQFDTTLSAEVVRLREQEQASWAAIADATDLGSPSKARRVYRNAKDAAIGSPLGRFEDRGGRLADRKEYARQAWEAGIVSESDRLLNAQLVEAYRDAVGMDSDNHSRSRR